MAEFLHILSEQYDYPQLTDEVLRYLWSRCIASIQLTSVCRDLSNKEFNNNDTRGPKSVSSFIIKLSELAPRLVIKQMTLLVKQLDSEVTWSSSIFRGNTLLTLLGLYASMRCHRGLW